MEVLFWIKWSLLIVSKSMWWIKVLVVVVVHNYMYQYCKYINLFYIVIFNSLKIKRIFVANKKIMIQRIQTLYLLVATFIVGGGVFVVDLWKNKDGILFFALDSFNTTNYVLIGMSLLFFISAILTFITIFLFKNRKLQFVIGRLTILINFILLGIIIFYSQNLSGEMEVSEKGIGLLIPIFAIVLVVLANRAIKKDEELVKSVDRLR